MNDIIEKNKHFSSLENLYQSAFLNEFYLPKIIVSEGCAEISLDAQERLQGSNAQLDQSVLTKVLLDACVVAANSLETKFLVNSQSFSCYFAGSIKSGPLRATANVVNSLEHYIVEAIAYNDQGDELARANGTFGASKVELDELPYYQE